MNGHKISWILAFLFLAHLTSAQFLDNFSDGDFTVNPPWSGDNLKFNVNAGKLKLMAPGIAETAFLSIPSQAIHDASWEFYLQMDFNPSGSNLAKIYLVSDQPNLNLSLKGYFVKAGNTSREISLYRQNGATETKIIDGLDDRLNLPLVKMKIKVTRSNTGVWQLFSDVGPSGVYLSEGSITDNTYSASAYFGIHCTYTATRSDKFWFDDFTVTGIPVPDTTPSSVQTVTTINAYQVNLLFSETLNPTSAQDAANFYLAGKGQPASVVLLTDQRTVQLSFLNPLTNGLTYTLQIAHIKDLTGNEMSLTTVSVLFFQPVSSRSKDIIITEIFPDPSPQIGLPMAEFIEIYNRSQNPFNLAGWQLSDGNSTGIFPSQIILPGEYRIITSSASLNIFSLYGATMGLVNFPTLNNGGDDLTIKNEEGFTIDSVSYHLDWYRDVDKQEGGWTLELIDPFNPCGEQDNWSASENSFGGTPGKQNSVFANKPDLTAPTLLSVFPDKPTQILLTFDEKLDPSAIDSEKFLLQPFIGISKISFSDHTLRTLQVDLKEDLVTRWVYTLEVTNIRDCNENEIQKSALTFGLPEKVDSLDVVVNEILFNPRAGGVDFVEVFNSSQKFLNLRNWKLCNFINRIPVNTVPLFSENFLFPPNSFAVFTTDPYVVKSQYPQSDNKNLFKTSLPGLPDDAGSLAVMNEEGEIMDVLFYSQDWHSEFIKNNAGVSLERIIAQGATNERGNWTSASANAGFATPGFLNSQRRGKQDFNEAVKVVPEIFSPDHGTSDFVQIQYHFDKGDWVANVRVYDQQGRLLKTLVSNETVSAEGFFRWDGDRDDGSKARMGYYMIWFEIFDSEGSVKTFRNRVIVSSR